MTSAFNNGEPSITRRRFGQWGVVMATTGVAGCGGGGEAPTVEPPAKSGALELVAGALGGAGFALQQGAMTRLPMALYGLAFNSLGDLQFVGRYQHDYRLGRRSEQGVSSFSAIPGQGFIGGLFDALDRYLVTSLAPAENGLQIAYLQGDTPISLAGGASSTALRDGVGTSAYISQFMEPLLAKDGLVYFVDIDPSTSRVVLRTLGLDGAVKTLLQIPNGSRLMESPTGGVRRYTSALYPAALTEWADLVHDGDVYTWQTLSNQWPFGQVMPLMKVHGTQDVYWAVSMEGGKRSLAQVDLSGRWLAMGWKLPGPFFAAAMDRSKVNATTLFVACGAGGESFEFEDGLEIVQCSLELPATAVYRWLGLSANRGEADDQNRARFSFVRGGEALADGAGGLILLEYQRANPRPNAASALRSVSALGQVSTWALEPRGSRLAIAYGYLVAFEPADNALVRTTQDGKSSWQPWTSSNHFASSGLGNLGVNVLRTDTTGLLWFAKRYWPLPFIGFGPFNGNSIVGTIDAAGQVRIVAGDPQAVYTPQTYPPLLQRPWYMDIADMAFEGGSEQVSWVLCNRVVLDDAGNFVRFHPELLRIDATGRQAFTLPSTNTMSRVYDEPFKQICVLPDRPGEVFLSSACGVHRWTQAKGLELMAGQDKPTPGGVVLGPLPAGLNLVKFLAPGPDRRSLYVGSENSVLKLVLPD